MSMFRFGSFHLPNDPETQSAYYGARLIYNEVLDGFGGIVADRQTPDGDEALIKDRIFPHYDEFMDLVRDHMEYGTYGLEPKIRFDGDDVICAQFGDDVIFVASAQGSFGYLYLSATVLQPVMT